MPTSTKCLTLQFKRATGERNEQSYASVSHRGSMQASTLLSSWRPLFVNTAADAYWFLSGSAAKQRAGSRAMPPDEPSGVVARPECRLTPPSSLCEDPFLNINTLCAFSESSRTLCIQHTSCLSSSRKYASVYGLVLPTVMEIDGCGRRESRHEALRRNHCCLVLRLPLFRGL